MEVLPTKLLAEVGARLVIVATAVLVVLQQVVGNRGVLVLVAEQVAVAVAGIDLGRQLEVAVAGHQVF